MFKKVPNTFIIISILILVSSVLTWVIPGGEYVFGDNSSPVFYKVESSPQNWQIFTAFQKGFAKQASIIVFVLIVGGVFWIINSTKAIDYAIFSLLKKMKYFERKRLASNKLISQLILLIIMLVFSVFGAVFGMSEETIAFVGIIIPLVISLGYDSITGVSVVFVAAGLGFAGAVLNPFTIGIAQGIAEIPLFSGITYRMFCWLIINVVGFSYILWYSNKVFKNPQLSPVYETDNYWRKKAGNLEKLNYHTPKQAWFYFILTFIITLIFAIANPSSDIKIGNSLFSIPALPVLSGLFLILGIYTLRKSVHYFVINILLCLVLYLIIGTMGYNWYINEISALFLAGGILTGLVMNMKGDEIVKSLVDGAKDIFSAAIIIGLAGGIIVILEDGKVIHTMLFYASEYMGNFGKVGTIGSMYGIQTVLNILIPSGSAKAAITMPIMAPFSDLVNLSRQATVMAFQFGDGFTNMITPTSAVLMAVLGVSKIPYIKWVKWVSLLIGILIVLGFILLLPTVLMELNGF
ncbi:MAG: YfcC family protein [Bacteroidales bacterium]|nr:YfcC family protein [Bacteroidales bacterium]MBN2817372.1 YfcC family protein [Bacteroidales bacterium]